MKNDNDRKAFCPACEDYRDTKLVEREETYTVSDRKITVPAKVAICTNCGESIGSDSDDQEILDAVHAEHRRQADMLPPGQSEA
jgi:YgiT-type zinc finger domain-containing protein